MGEIINLTPEQLRTLQLIELEMLVEVDRICRKNHIQYTLDGGTLLGAVRHKGFIPWDDDADIVMFRHEYARFYHACKSDLDTERFFLQEYRTDPNYRWGYAKLRRKGTEYVRVGQEHMRYKTGVCIDIFPLDYVPDQYILRRIYYGVNYCIRKILYSELGKEAASTELLRIWYRILFKVPRNYVFAVRNRIAAIVNQKPTELVCHTMCPNPGPTCKYGMPAGCYAEYRQYEFEGMLFQGLSDYDNFLSLSYGEYMKFPQMDKRKGTAPPSKVKLINITLEEIQERYRKDNLRYQI